MTTARERVNAAVKGAVDAFLVSLSGYTLGDVIDDPETAQPLVHVILKFFCRAECINPESAKKV